MKTRNSIFVGFAFILLQLFSTLQAQTGKNAALEALGGTCGTLLYNTYLAIGAVGDGYEGEVFDKETAITLMDEQVSMMDGLDEQYGSLLTSGFLTDPSDKEYMQSIKHCVGLLRTQAKALKEYLDGSGPQDGSDFQTAREASWEEISSLLGIK